MTQLSAPHNDVNYHSVTQNFTSHQGIDYWHLAIRGHILKSRNQYMLVLGLFMKVHVLHTRPSGGVLSQMNPNAKTQEEEEVEQDHF